MRHYRHGLALLKQRVTKLGSRAIDGRSKLSYALKRWQRDLIEDLGGEENVSTQQLAIIELAATSKLILGSIDAWILNQPTLITRNKTLLPVVRERQQLANGLAQNLVQLGLQRRTKVTSLSEILARDDKPEDSNGTADEGNEQP